jgi:N-acyl-D-amino-acid deacylase
MRDGAFGLSSALIYVPGTFAKTEELLALAKVAAKYKGIYISHIRGESFNLFNAIDEAIRHRSQRGTAGGDLSPQGRAKANWGRMSEAIAAIEKAMRPACASPRRCIPIPPAAPAWRRRCRCGCRKAAATRCSSG